MNFLDEQFHRAQALYQSTPRACSEQQAVAPFFYEPAPGTAAFYEIPTYLRDRVNRKGVRVNRKDFDNRCRLAQYADRVRAHIQEAA